MEVAVETVVADLSMLDVATSHRYTPGQNTGGETGGEL